MLRWLVLQYTLCVYTIVSILHDCALSAIPILRKEALASVLVGDRVIGSNDESIHRLENEIEKWTV